MTQTFDEAALAFLDPGDGRKIAIRHRPGTVGKTTVVFLPGYASDMEGAKALAIDAFCGTRGLGCLRLDYSGTGSSAGAFEEGTLQRWLDEVLAAIDLAAPDGPLILAGSSMGGWLALLAATRRPQRVKAILGIAAAPDFTEWGFSVDDKLTMLREGRVERANPSGGDPQVTTSAFFQSGEALRVLVQPIALPIPVRLVHGLDDKDVPVGVPLKLVEMLGSGDVQLTLLKNGGHRLSEPHEIHAILMALHNLVELVK